MSSNGIDLYYEDRGHPDDPVLLLVSGLGSQCIGFDEELCLGFVDRGFRVVRFDNRDVGHSTLFDDHSADPLGGSVPPAYLLRDMAADAVGLLDALEVGQAHVLGTSMGGMIAQTLAIEHPERVRSLTSVMSTTGEPGVGQPTPEAVTVLLEAPAVGREAIIDQQVRNARVIASPDHFDEGYARRRATAAYDRRWYPEGTARQLHAIIASGSRAEGLAALRVPTLVIHGDVDPLIPLDGGERTAELVPGAELVVVAGMAHDLPPVLWSNIIEPVTRLAAATAA